MIDIYLSSYIIKHEVCHCPFVIPRHLTRIGVLTTQISPESLGLINISLIPCGLGNPGSSPDNLVVVAAPGLVETTSGDSVSVLSFMEKMISNGKT